MKIWNWDLNNLSIPYIPQLMGESQTPHVVPLEELAFLASRVPIEEIKALKNDDLTAAYLIAKTITQADREERYDAYQANPG